jgi:hypothetical protein
MTHSTRRRNWQIFQQSGTVTASTAFVARIIRTEGFEAQDFSQCLGQLNLIAPSIPE